MSISLKKGQKISLAKSDGSKLTKLMIGLGWDAAKAEGGFFGKLFGSKKDIDCDASVIMCIDGHLKSREDDIVYFGNLKHKSGAVVHMGDNLTGEGDGDDEQIKIDLTSVPSEYDKLIFVVNIYKAVERKQHFGMIANAFIRVVDDTTGEEICKYNLTDKYDGKLAMVLGEVYKKGGEWKFNAIGQGTEDTGLKSLSDRFI